MAKKFIKNIGGLLPINIFTFRSIFLLGFGFPALVILSNYALRYSLQNSFNEKLPRFWPISIFWLRTPGITNLIVAIIVSLCFILIIRYLAKIRYKLFFIIIFGLFLVLGTNLIQGWNYGFRAPISGNSENGILYPLSDKGIQYYHDAIKINEPLSFLSNFQRMQPNLLCHSRTHPPGAVLLIYLLLKLLGNPVLITITLATASTCLSMFFLYRILLTEFGNDLSRYATFLFILIPSIQIYYAATIDALIASFLLGALYFFIHPRPIIGIIGSVICLFLASFMTFAFLFALPVMAGFEIIRKRSYFRILTILFALMLIYIVFYVFFNFNYLISFKIAVIIDNSRSFRLFSHPLHYIVGRFTGIYEILLFFGPFLGTLAVNGIRTMEKNDSNLSTITWLGLSTLLAIFITGAFKIGETARICLFIYPYIFFPVVSFLKSIDFSRENRNILLYLVFFQTVFMQAFGFYAW